VPPHQGQGVDDLGEGDALAVTVLGEPGKKGLGLFEGFVGEKELPEILEEIHGLPFGLLFRHGMICRGAGIQLYIVVPLLGNRFGVGLRDLYQFGGV